MTIVPLGFYNQLLRIPTVMETIFVEVDFRSNFTIDYAEHRNLEYRLGSIPCLFHPPTPSATTNNCFDAK